MFELVQMTAAYSNAVLMVVLTNVTDVATKLDLPITRPVQSSHVGRFVCDSRKGSMGGWLTLTNGYEFWYEYGAVYAMDRDRCYFHLQDPDEIPRFFGKSRMSEAEAVELARRSIRQLGYNPSWLRSEKPVVQWAKTAPRDQPNVVPRCRVTWERIEADGLTSVADIEINTDAKRVEMFTLRGRVFQRKPPDIPQPPVIPKPPPSPPSGGQRLTPLTNSQSAAALTEICSKSTEMAKRLGLPIKLPIRPQDVKESDNGFWQGDLSGQIILAGGWRFNYRHGHVISFHAPDSEYHVGMHEVWTNMPPVDTRKLYGKVRYTKQQIADFAAREVRKLGYPDPSAFLDQPPMVWGGPHERTPNYSRFQVIWRAADTINIEEPNAQFIRAEVDGVTLELKSLWLRSSNLYQPSIIQPETPKK